MSIDGDPRMRPLTGMEKFSHLEDKIYLTVQYAQKLREENQEITRENEKIKREIASLSQFNREIEGDLRKLLDERDVIHLKVETMVDAITKIDSDVAEAVGR
jgi:chromosome segregation ATPase